MKKNNVIKVSLSDDIAKKFAFVCKSEGITIQNQIASIVRQKISYFERVKGKISPKDLQNVSLEEFSEE